MTQEPVKTEAVPVQAKTSAPEPPKKLAVVSEYDEEMARQAISFAAEQIYLNSYAERELEQDLKELCYVDFRHKSLALSCLENHQVAQVVCDVLLAKYYMNYSGYGLLSASYLVNYSSDIVKCFCEGPAFEFLKHFPEVKVDWKHPEIVRLIHHFRRFSY